MRQGIEKRKVRHLLNFSRYYTAFAETDFLHKSEEQLELITKSRQTMGIREAILHQAREVDKEGGLEKGKSACIHEKERIVVTRCRQKKVWPLQ